MKSIGIAAIFFYVLALSSGQENSDKDEDKIQFWFYPNSANIEDRTEFNVDEPDTIINSNFLRNKHVKVLIHGSGANCNEHPFPLLPLQAYLKEKSTSNADYNVICVDWGPLSVFNIKRGDVQKQRSQQFNLVGERVALLLKILKNNSLIHGYGDVHVIGHSFGAHLSGIVGLKTFESTNFKERIGRISGLDAARPFHEETNLAEQLDVSDADFVDITHTNDKHIGKEGSYGHADFYPDGGENQSQCRGRGVVTAIADGIIGGCSHLIVAEYWATSINYKNFTACKANSYDDFKKDPQCTGEPQNLINWGDSGTTNVRGKYYFDL